MKIVLVFNAITAILAVRSGQILSQKSLWNKDFELISLIAVNAKETIIKDDVQERAL